MVAFLYLKWGYVEDLPMVYVIFLERKEGPSPLLPWLSGRLR